MPRISVIRILFNTVVKNTLALNTDDVCSWIHSAECNAIGGWGGGERLPYNLKCPIYLRATGVHVNESTAEAGLELQPRVASFYAHLLECKDRVASQT